METLTNSKTEIALQSASLEVAEFVKAKENELILLENAYLNVVPDCSTEEGYDFSKLVRAEVLPFKTDLEKYRKEVKEPVLKMASLIDEGFNALKARSEALYKPHEDAYRAEDKRLKLEKEARLAAVQGALDSIIRARAALAYFTSEEITTEIERLKALVLDPEVLGDRFEEAEQVLIETIDYFKKGLKKQKAVEKIEAQEAEEAKAKQAIIDQQREQALKEEQEQREQSIREQEQKRLNEQHEAQLAKVKQDAENAKLAAAKAVQDEKDRIEAERLRLEAEQAERDADTRHRANVNRAILAAMVKEGGITENQGKAVITAILKGLITNTKITY